MHRGFSLYRSSTVTCTNGIVSKTTNMNTSYFYYSYRVPCSRYKYYWDFSELWGLKIVIVPPKFQQLTVLDSLEADCL